MPLHIWRGWVEEVHPHGLWVRGTYTNDGTDFMGDLNREDLPPAEFAKAHAGSFYVLKQRIHRSGRPGRMTFYIVERFWTKNEMKKVRKKAREFAVLFGVHE